MITRLKQWVYAFLPPGMRNALSRPIPDGPDSWVGEFPSIESATHATSAIPYAHIAQREDYIRHRLSPGDIGRQLDIKHLGILASIGHCLSQSTCSTFNVIDFGGGLGLHYHRLRTFLPSTCQIFWNIVELPTIVEAGKADGNSGEVRYFDDLQMALDACGGAADLIIASGVVQTVDDPMGLVRCFAGIARFILLVSLPFTDRNCDSVAVNQGHSPPYPLWFFSAANFRAATAAAGLKSELEWQNSDTFWLLNHKRTKPAHSILFSTGLANRQSAE